MQFVRQKKYVVHIRALKQALMHGLKLRKVQKAISFYQKTWMKPFIDMNIDLRKETKNNFETIFFKLMSNAVFGEPMENVRKHRDIKLVTTNKRRNRLVSELNYPAIKWFSENLVAIEMRKTKVKMNKPTYVDMAMLNISKTLMYEFWYEYLKPKYGDKIELCCMCTDSLTPFIKTRFL